MALAVHADSKSFTLVIDAGHGGGDSGAKGAISVEKNLTLKFALAFGKLVEQNCPDVKVIYTRKTDRFVELYRRAEIANKNKADLFISIHINSLPKGHQAMGFQTYTLGKSRRTGKKNGVLENLEVAKQENAVIYLEKDYQQTYHGYDPNSPESNIMFEFVQDKNMENSVDLAKFMQKYVCEATGRQDMGAHQDNLAVLRLTSMPGCLIELGFISSKAEEQFMNSAAATGKYARGIYNAFAAYKKKHGGKITVPYLPEPKILKPEETPKPVEEEVKPVEVEEVVEQTPVPVEEVKPAVVEEVKPKPVPEKETTKETTASSAPVFKVQILTASKALNKNDARFKGEKEVDSYREGGLVKYTVGASTDYNQIYQLRKSLVAKFPEAFIIAFRNGEKMNVQEAVREFRNRKK
jgi:N-acetylmuramoyl-L-alanine amidase